MLVLTRIPGEKIVINHGEIVIEISAVRAKQVKLGITAPSHVIIDREEVHVKRQLGPTCQPIDTPIPDQRYFTVGEVAVLVGIKPKELMAWQNKFPAIKPHRRRCAQGRGESVYRRNDVLLLRQLRELIVEKNYSDDQVKQVLSELNAECAYVCNE